MRPYLRDRRAKYFTKLVAAFLIMQVGWRIFGNAGFEVYALPLSVLPALAFFWLFWPDIWHTSPLSKLQLNLARYSQILIFLVALLLAWIVDQKLKSTSVEVVSGAQNSMVRD